VRVILLPFYLLYLFVITARNALYDTGMIQPVSVGVPVVSVGNVTVGGTGKTPLIIALAQRAVAAGKTVGVVARGYGAVADAEGRTDEVAMIAGRVPEAQVFVSPSKLLAAKQAAEAGVDLIFVDDGFQHRRLHRDLDIAVVDARVPVSNGYVLPLGGLREPASSLARADIIVLSHTDRMDEETVDIIKASVTAHRRGVPVILARHTPIGVRSCKGGPTEAPESLAGRELFLFSGIASPDGFRQTVEALGANVIGALGFPDHHAFDAASLAEVRGAARTAQLMCTEKDAAKVAAIPGTDDVLCLVIDLVLDRELEGIPGLDG
jgi:tetraacyldisaccharide 4'-kinase